MKILGISAFYHDSAAALLVDGKIVAAAQEERFSRKKHDDSFPRRAVEYCLKQGAVGTGGLGAVVFYDKPILKFARILETYMTVAPRGLRSFLSAMPVWLRKKLWIPYIIEKELEDIGVGMPAEMLFAEHHESHVASAFFPSPFERAAVLTIDGVGEWSTTALAHGIGNQVEIKQEIHFPHSLGLLYSAVTYHAGFRVNSGEYKLMGLAPYGEPRFLDVIREHLIDIKEDGSFRLNMAYFGYLDSLRMTNDAFSQLFDGPPRRPEAALTQREADLARSVQVITEEVVMRMARHAKRVTGESNLCLAGGVALNCVANGRLKREGPFDNLWVQPAAGDAGGSIGAALLAWHSTFKQPREADGVTDGMQSSYLGPAFSDDEIGDFLQENNYPARRLPDEEWAAEIARLIDEGKVIGLFQGRMEFGPRALGNRSIIGDARSPEMQSVMNLKIKNRESFRPFAPACLKDRASEYFDLEGESPYMLMTAPVRSERRLEPETNPDGDFLQRVNRARSDIPAVTHVDYSARVQTVSRESNPRFYELLRAFNERTGCGVVINTSFNVRGEPIVCTPEDAYRCFMSTETSHLVLGSYLLDRNEQPAWQGKREWQRSHILD